MERGFQDGPESLLGDMRWVFGLARSLVSDPAAAEDVTQDTWIAALKRGPGEGPPPRKWLAKVVRNFARQRARSESSRTWREQSVARREDLPSAEELALRMENQRLLAEAVTRLDEPYRSTIILRYSEELAPTEIARKLSLPPGTVRRRLKEGLDRLRKDLDGRFDGKRHAWIAAFQPFVEGGPASLAGTTAAAAALPGAVLVMKVSLCTVVLACGAGLWFLLQGSEPSGAAVASAGSFATSADLALDAEEGAGPSAGDPAITRRPEPAAADGVAVTGRVVLPAGAPEDPTLEVFAVKEEIDYVRLVDLLEAGVPIARSAVHADGTFRIAVPEAPFGFLMLRGRYLYTEKAHVVTLGLGERAATIVPDRGAWITGELVADEGVGGEPVSLYPRTRLKPTVGMSWKVFRSDVRTDVEGRFEFRAVPAPRSYRFLAVPSKLEAHRSVLDGVEPLRHTDFAVSLGRGGKVRGTVVDVDGEPVPGATVEAFLPDIRFGSGDQLVRRVTADGEGAFKVKGLPAGEAMLVASKPGKLSSQRERVLVAAGASVDGLVIELGRGKTLAGTVRWPDGTPAEGIYVRADFDRAYRANATNLNALRGSWGETTSGAGGRFRLAGLGNGPFVVRAKKPGFFAQLDGVTPGEGQLELVLLAPQSLAGRVVGHDGEPVTSFRLHALRVVQGALGETALDRRSRRFLSEQGAFQLDGLAAGLWRVWAQADEVVTAEPVPVTLPPPLDAGAVVLRTILAGAVSGVVLAPNGRPVQGAAVRVVGDSPAWMADVLAEIPPPQTVTDEAGRFELRGIEPGTVSLVADAAGFASGATEQVEVRSGETAEGLRLELFAGGRLTGEVLAEDGGPAADHLVYLQPSGDRPPRSTATDASGAFLFENLDAGTWAVGTIDARGFRFAGEEMRMEELFASMDSAVVEIRGGETTHVVIGEPEPSAVRVLGRVENAGAPHAGVPVRFMPEGGASFDRWVFALTDAEGNYELELPAPGVYDVGVKLFPNRPADQSQITFHREIPAVDRYRLDLALPDAAIAGRVDGPDGAPAELVRVTLIGEPEPDTPVAFVELFTDADGRFEFPSLRAGRYTVAAGGSPLTANGGPTFARTSRSGIELQEGERLDDLHFRLDPPSSVLLEVIDAAGAPVAGATVFARDASGAVVDVISPHATGADGRYEYPGLSAEDYTFFARTWESASAESAPVTAERGGTAPVRLTLQPATRLRVQLLAGAGEPLAGGVVVTDADGHEAAGYVLADIMRILDAGAFSRTSPLFGPLAPGTYRVERFGADGSTASLTVALDGEPEVEVVLRPGF